MVASSSNLLLLASTHQQHAEEYHVWNDDSTLPNDHDLLHIPTMNRRRGFMIRSNNSNNNIRGSSTGDLKDVIMLETMLCTPTITATSSSTAVALRKHEREQRDDIDSAFNIRSTSTRNVFSCPTATPSMPNMLNMPALPTPAMNQSSKQKNEMSHSNNDNDNANAPMKKTNHIGRRLL